MPELPEVETIRRTLAQHLPGRRICEVEIRLPKLVSPEPERFQHLLRGQRFSSFARRGKLLLAHLSDWVLLVHFRLTGQLIYLPKFTHEPRFTHLVFTLDQGYLFYADLRQFGGLELVAEKDLVNHPFLKKLGPEPLDLDFQRFYKLLQRRRRLKALLLDQEVLAGLGNIYVDESLFRAGLHPERLASSLDRKEAQKLWQVIRQVLLKAIETGGSSVRNYVDGEGREGTFQNHHLVYNKKGEPCPRCAHPILYTKIAGRGTYFCPQCQPL